jgi:DNA helicase-2/ATP-dependent DNA helicase PcrA
VGERLKEYRLSVTHLNDYLKCPRSFFFTRILKVPAPRNAAMAFGTSVHASLEFLFSEMTKSGAERFPRKESFLERFSREMERHRDSFTDVEFERRLKVGMENLGRYYDENVGRWHRDVRLEKNYEAVLNGEIRINGLVDKLEIHAGKLVNLVDYKTGRYDRKKFQPPDPEKAEKAVSEGKEPKFEDLHGGDYWRQAVFYKILVENSPKESYSVSTAEFSFVEPDKTSGTFMIQCVEIGPEDIDTVRGQIETVYCRIMNREFSEGCTNSYCEWCNGR